jgi:predicted DNA-binding transcriptional regulator AlpA
MESLFTENEVSGRIKVSLACLRRWRLCGEGPQYVKLNNMVRYRESDLANWMAELPSAGNGKRLSVRNVVRTKLTASA